MFLSLHIAETSFEWQHMKNNLKFCTGDEQGQVIWDLGVVQEPWKVIRKPLLFVALEIVIIYILSIGAHEQIFVHVQGVYDDLQKIKMLKMLL